jgi:hypothetical protein
VRLVPLMVRLAILCAAAGAFAAAGLCDEAWFSRHVRMPALYLPPAWWLLPVLRGGLVALGIAAIAASRPLARLAARPLDAARVALALALAVAAAEFVLRRGERGTTLWRARKLELRMGRPDARFGWALQHSRTLRIAEPGAAPVAYAFDAWGDRARDAAGAPDPSRPSLVVAGESMGVGHGLPFEDTFAARLASRLDLQLVNVSAGGYGTDQSLLRLEDALGRLQRPAACAMVFLPIQLQRNVQDYRPRLALHEGSLRLAAPASGFFQELRLRDLWVNELPVLGEERLRDSIALTAAVLREGAGLCRSRGAAFAVLVVSVGPTRAFEAHPEAGVLRDLMVVQQLPFALVDVQEDELIPGDGHPGARASERIAAALAEVLDASQRAGAPRNDSAAARGSPPADSGASAAASSGVTDRAAKAR